MRRHRLFVPAALESGREIELDGDRSHYLMRVLRLRRDDTVYLFDGAGGEIEARIVDTGRTHVRVRLGEVWDQACESPLQITLAQSISRGERMDQTLQKATELGATAFQPLITRRTEVRLSGKRPEKRLAHWRGVIVAACEQCGRAILPELAPPRTISELVSDPPSGTLVLLSPGSERPLSGVELTGYSLHIAAGPEGGFSDAEETALQDAGWLPVAIGPRILRTETAGPTAIALAQGLWGDF